jgi:serine/threonine-protein kinase RsbW
MPLGIDLELSLPRDNATVPLVRHILQATLTEFGVASECVSDVLLALTEAAANVVEHSAGEDEYQVTVSVDEDRCDIRVIDQHNGFDAALPDAFPGSEAERGRGLLLMRALVDTLQFENQPETGTVVHLTKRLAFDVAPLTRARPVPPHP